MSIKSELTKLWNIATSPSYRAARAPYRAFRKEHGSQTPAQFPHVRQGDVVLDIGGYLGDWSADMTKRYGVVSHVFEPNPGFAAAMGERFGDYTDVHVHAYAVGSEDGALELSDQANASSALVNEGPTVKGMVRALGAVSADLALGDVAVIKMNIEGGEYDLLPAMIDSGFMQRVDRLVVQFHKYSSEDVARRDAIREGLSHTHVCEWAYPFVWEQWARKDA
ncbi:FkbM family methyltransferase [Pseudosulfitobacter koreensis]|uniref:FkbM family methyltransferase n=1 Tax=Pseudosulfitobacter koreensis TaxID=2968472 RepID=A0ABT1Z155_9RHOB|nr:FkbM family methyltransferase [Pseudosulfitobacter koreense]MCR8826877.1 FkbM family methyltransferase [Pseudosulfitobacter koreense]